MAEEDPKAESAEFSREWETDGDLEPVDGGLKNDFGSCRIRRGTCSGRLESGLSTVSNNDCKTESESWSTRRTRFDFCSPSELRAIFESERINLETDLAHRCDTTLARYGLARRHPTYS